MRQFICLFVYRYGVQIAVRYRRLKRGICVLVTSWRCLWETRFRLTSDSSRSSPPPSLSTSLFSQVCYIGKINLKDILWTELQIMYLHKTHCHVLSYVSSEGVKKTDMRTIFGSFPFVPPQVNGCILFVLGGAETEKLPIFLLEPSP